MELRCAECETNYELDEFSACPNCGSDKSIIPSEEDPFSAKRIMKYRIWVVLGGAFFYYLARFFLYR
jgi:Zn finger protein HypA/HybF involved in hydrogenase expression